MDNFFQLTLRLLPFYLSVVIGYVAGRYLQISRESIGKLLLYVITPVVVFNAVLTSPLSAETLALPIVTFFLACVICLAFYVLAKSLWRDSTKNILAYAVGSANSGFFGLPVALVLWGNSIFNTVILCMLGWVVYDSTVGFWIAIKNDFTTRKALQKLLQLPSLYAILLAVILNMIGIQDLGTTYQSLVVAFQATFTLLGPMLIGIAIGHREKAIWDTKAIMLSFAFKFVLWPLAMAAILVVDSLYFHIFAAQTQQVLFLLSLVPFAANTVALASAFQLQPQKASTLVILGVLFASLYIPIVLYIWA